MSSLGEAIATAAIGGLVSGGVITFVAGALLQRRTEEVRAEVQLQFNESLERLRDDLERRQLQYRSTREWEEASLAELLAPAAMQLERTKRAFDRWGAPNQWIENKIIREANAAVRDLLLTKGHLLPPSLREDAQALIEHYDRWLEEFDRIRVQEKSEEGYVFTGPKGFGFPREAEQHFLDYFRQTWEKLYAPGTEAG
jgi:hypothetical protein